jgi:anhydro-N-acetylmuramic acid kinase
VLNIGGIANISVLNPGMPVLGYDTGPGNVLLDGWCLRHCQQAYDKEARFALQGKNVSTLLDQFNRDPYFPDLRPKVPAENISISTGSINNCSNIRIH